LYKECQKERTKEKKLELHQITKRNHQKESQETDITKLLSSIKEEYTAGSSKQS